MKNKTSTLNRLFSKIFSFVLLVLLSLAPAINPVTASANDPLVTPPAPFVMPPMTTTVSNATPITIGDNSTNPNTVPYPSNITIAGAVGTITNVTVVLRGLSIGRPRDLDILLVSPTGQALILVSDVAGVTEPNSTTTNVTITLADGSPSLPGDVIGTTPLVSGTFRPTNNGAGEAAMPAPAPALTAANYPPHSTDAGSTVCTGCTRTFATQFAQPGVAANGVWSLYVDDDSLTGTAGTMAQGWTLNVTTDGVPTTAAGASVSGRVVNSDGRGVSGVKIGMLEPNGQTRYAMTNPFGYFNFADVPAGETYVFSVKAKGYLPTSVSREVTEDVSDLVITLQPE
ncbi:MAG TPA: carboxypeptidase-like regulatory domain-containing protein [Pyrinomonadaceae bacterium]|jgi:hypothetical protein